MLISVALVLLMMSLFAQIFQMAGGAISKQRGLMENDQRARTLQTIIKGDLDKRTFRKMLPFAANEDTSGVEAEITKRRGYFYYSENDPNNQLDDVLQFTMQSSIVVYNKDASPYYGRALQLTSFGHPNQPDTDDAQLVPNNTGQSTLAEVSLFVRNGSLYRRQLLIREPISVAGSTEQPQDATNNTANFFDPVASPAPVVLYPSGVSGATTFWDNFDYSAFLTLNGGGAETGAAFLGSNALNNDGTSAIQLGVPRFRFGHNAVAGSANFGSPKEYANSTGTAEYIGRYTLQECSDPDFEYPQSRWGTTNPMALATSVTLDPITKVVTAPADLTAGPRRGEDLLMSNVHSFDVMVWDENYGGFASIGDPNLPATSDYYLSSNPLTTKRRNSNYGPRVPATESLPTVANAVFDTWHPGIDLDANSIADEPPYRPITFRPDYATIGTEPTMPDWEPNKVYNSSDLGTIVFPTAAPAGYPFYYRLIAVDKPPKNSKAKGKGGGLLGNNSSGDEEPVWPRIAGLIVEDNALSWQAVDNRKPLKAIKIEIRFVDTSTQQMRQLTIIQSLVD